ncbi:MAG: amidohydrolase family protein [Acidimicrobiales bacterium]
MPTSWPTPSELARATSGAALVLDHLGKPDIVRRPRQMARRPQAARRPGCFHVTCKLSGLVTEADPDRWTTGDLRPFVEEALDAFGPRRLMWGSDWPVVTAANTDHDGWRSTTEELLAPLTADERDQILCATACRVYGIEPAAPRNGA